MVWIFFVIILTQSDPGADIQTFRFPDADTCEYVRAAFVERRHADTFVTGCKEFRTGRPGIANVLRTRGYRLVQTARTASCPQGNSGPQQRLDHRIDDGGCRHRVTP